MTEAISIFKISAYIPVSTRRAFICVLYVPEDKKCTETWIKLSSHAEENSEGEAITAGLERKTEMEGDRNWDRKRSKSGKGSEVKEKKQNKQETMRMKGGVKKERLTLKL